MASDKGRILLLKLFREIYRVICSRDVLFFSHNMNMYIEDFPVRRICTEAGGSTLAHKIFFHMYVKLRSFPFSWVLYVIIFPNNIFSFYLTGLGSSLRRALVTKLRTLLLQPFLKKKSKNKNLPAGEDEMRNEESRM